MLCIVGGGKMGLALAAGIIGDADSPPLTIVDHNEERRAYLSDWINGKSNVSISDRLVACDDVIIAVKPKDVEMAISDAVDIGAKRVLSVAAGISLNRLHEWAGGRIPVLRAMPNIGALVSQSATVLCGGVTAQPADMDWAEKLLQKSGTVVRVDETKIDAATGLSGSGPAYLFLIAEAMIDAGVTAGLPRAVAETLTTQTFVGAAALLSGTDESAQELRADVTTPAGTTAAGLLALERRALRAGFTEAVAAAAHRSSELGH